MFRRIFEISKRHQTKKKGKDEKWIRTACRILSELETITLGLHNTHAIHASFVYISFTSKKTTIYVPMDSYDVMSVVPDTHRLCSGNEKKFFWGPFEKYSFFLEIFVLKCTPCVNMQIGLKKTVHFAYQNCFVHMNSISISNELILSWKNTGNAMRKNREKSH